MCALPQLAPGRVGQRPTKAPKLLRKPLFERIQRLKYRKAHKFFIVPGAFIVLVAVCVLYLFRTRFVKFVEMIFLATFPSFLNISILYGVYDRIRTYTVSYDIVYRRFMRSADTQYSRNFLITSIVLGMI